MQTQILQTGIEMEILMTLGLTLGLILIIIGIIVIGVVHEDWRKDGSRRRIIDSLEPTGKKIWYIAGQRITNYKQYQKMTGCGTKQLIFLKLKYGKIYI